MRILPPAVLAMLVALPMICQAEENAPAIPSIVRVTVPAIVSRGFEEFQKNGNLAAVNAWMVGSARETDDEVQDAAVAKMRGVQSLYGRMLGYEMIRTVVLSPSAHRLYATVKFEKGVAWMSFDCYRPDKEWIVSRFDFRTNANLILPPNILGGQ